MLVAATQKVTLDFASSETFILTEACRTANLRSTFFPRESLPDSRKTYLDAPSDALQVARTSLVVAFTRSAAGGRGTAAGSRVPGAVGGAVLGSVPVPASVMVVGESAASLYTLMSSVNEPAPLGLKITVSSQLADGVRD